MYMGQGDILPACVGKTKHSKMCLAVPRVLTMQSTVYIYEKLEKRAVSGRKSLVIAENYQCCGLKIRKRFICKQATML